MIELKEIVMTAEGEGGMSSRGRAMREGLTTGTRRRGSFGSLNDIGENVAPIRGSIGEWESGNDVVLGEQPVDSSSEGTSPTQEDSRAEFYETYRREAEEYDRDFLRRHDEDSNTTLIFAGLIAAVTSAFIIQVHSQLNPDPSDETNALLRVLIHKIDNTTFGDNVPTLPQQNGPPRTVIQVQCILYTSLATSLLSAFLATLGKQWLNRYGSTDTRGTAFERIQDRQKKLDGIAAWYFDHVMESLPMMLQLALLLLGYALSRYLWEIDTAIASVVIGVTLFGVLSYLFIVIAGAISESCPYQTPWTNVVRHTYIQFAKYSKLHSMSVAWWGDIALYSVVELAVKAFTYPFALPIAFLIDAFRFGRAAFQTTLIPTRRACSWRVSISPTPDQVFDNQAAELDFRCVLWVLRTSLDRVVDLWTLKFLGTVLLRPGPTSAVLVDCFNIFSGYIVVDDYRVAKVTGGPAQAAGISATCFLRAFARLPSTESSSSVIEYVRQRYKKAFPSFIDLRNLPCPIIMEAIYHLFTGHRSRRFLDWGSYSSSDDELKPFAHTLAGVAQIEHYRRGDMPKVPRWLLRFALRFLSQDPLPPTSVLIDCLTIIAIDLGCNVLVANKVASDDSARLERLEALIIEKYETIASKSLRMDVRKVKATIAFLPYVARRQGNGVALPVSLKYATLDAFRYGHRFLRHASDISAMMQFWIEAASVLPYTDDVGENVVDTLLQIASIDKLSPHIPVLAWDWLNKRPALHSGCQGLHLGTSESVVQIVQQLKDVKLVVSYLHIIWSEWSISWDGGSSAMGRLIREKLSGIGLAECRTDLIRRLDYILLQLDQRQEHIRPIDETAFLSAKREYGGFRRELLEMNEEATRMPIESYSTFMCALPLPCP